MANDPKRFHVLTGGPGSGKSTLIAALRRMGFNGSTEAGRAIIRDQVAIGGPALPWRDPRLFAELMLCWEMRSYRMAEQQTGPVFFDRGLPDVVGYLRLTGLPVPAHINEAAAAFLYNRRVFVAPPWPEIFHQDGERKQTFAEAERTYEALVAAYAGVGYELAELPRSTVEERVRFVLDRTGIARPPDYRAGASPDTRL
jgi:predicted ATPase